MERIENIELMNEDLNILQKIEKKTNEKFVNENFLETSGGHYYNAFNSCNGKLIHLMVESSTIETFPIEILDFSDLEVLIFKGPLNFIPKQIFEKKTLKQLYFDSLSLEYIDYDIDPNFALKKFSIIHSNLIEISSSINNLKNLECLFFGNNKIETLPNTLCDLKILKELHLSYNPIKKLPDKIGNLKSLEKLILHKANIYDLPNSIGDLSSLKWLFLPFNNISKLPNSIGNLESLEWFNLRENHLSTLPDSIVKLKSLKRFDLSNNQFTSFPDILKTLSIKELYLDRNPFNK